VAVDGDFRVRELGDGMATVSVTFVETEAEPRFPDSAPAAAQRLPATADDAVAALRARAEAAGSASLAAAAMDNLESVVTDAADALESALAPLLTVAEELASLKARVAAIAVGVASLAAEPVDALDAFLELFEALPTLPARTGIDALLKAHGFTATGERVAATTIASESEQTFFDLLATIARTAMVVQAAKLAAEADYDSFQDAVAVRDAVAEALDAEAEFADDATYAELQQLRADLIRAVPGEDSDLPRLVTYTPPATVPSLVLAHRLYGNVDREADICTRNSILRPGFIPGSVALEVLSDA
jgi:prophage DNA circulation protein